MSDSLILGAAYAPQYLPPYESSLHDEFAWHLVKYLHEDVTLETGVEIETPGAFYTSDFVVTVPSADTVDPWVVAFEIGGGRDAHTERLRLIRDARLMASGVPDALYRLRGSDLVYRLEDVLYMVSRWDPLLFSGRGRRSLDKLASWEAGVVRIRPEQPSVLVTYVVNPETEDYADPEVSKRHLTQPEGDPGPFLFLRRFSQRYSDAWQSWTSADVNK
ncbi:MAG: hypothetical protein AAGG50_03775 [Bacteroidota bacterium]